MAEIMKEQAQEASVLDALLGATVPNVEKDLPTARYKVDRLSPAPASCMYLAFPT